MADWIPIPIVAAVVLLAAVVLRRLPAPPRLVVGERGILHRGLGWGWIPWDEIEGAYPPSPTDRGETVRLRVRVTERLSRVLRRRHRRASAGESLEVALDLDGTDLSAVDVLGEILAHRAPSTDRS